MSKSISIEEARALFRERLVAPSDVATALSTTVTELAIPFRRDELEAAAQAGEILICRTAAVDGEPLSIRSLIQRFPQAFDAKLLQASGYQLKNEWGIELEPLAATETCRPGWALFQPQVLPASCNRSHPEQDSTLREYEKQRSLPERSVRRRSAIEAVYDTVLYFAVYGTRLLGKTWDWTSTQTIDRGLLHVGGFGGAGMQVLGYSPGVRHGALGVCPTRQPE